MVKSEPQKFLRRKQRHACLVRRSIALTLVALDAGRDKVVGRAFAALSSRQDVIERQVLCVFVFSAILAPITVAYIDTGPFHSGLTILAADVNIMTQPNDRRHRKLGRGRTKDIVAVVFLDENGAAEPQADGTRNADRS